MTSERRKRLFALAWTLMIVLALSVPGSGLPNVSVAHFDKVVHFFFFAVLAWAWMQALEAPINRRALIVLAAGITFAILTEVYQGALISGREADGLDALADSLGLTVSVLAFRLRRMKKQRAST